RLDEYATGNPFGAYAGFLRDVAIPHSVLFAHLTAYGEAAVGIGLTFGLFTRVAASVGVLLMLNYLAASFWMGPAQQGFHIVLIACMIAFLGAGAGRRWGIDAVLVHRHKLRWPVGAVLAAALLLSANDAAGQEPPVLVFVSNEQAGTVTII